MAKIIVVDDEKSIRITFKEFLNNEGYEVFVASNVEEAMALIKKQDCDLVITDIIMPKVSGMKLLEMIHNAKPKVPVIIMTGKPTFDTAMASLKNNAYDYLLKPIDKTTLVAAAKRAVLYKTTNDEKIRLEKENLEYQKKLESLVSIRTSSLQKAMYATISTVAAMTKLRDPYTAGHSIRVGNLSVAIGQKLNLSKKEIDSLYVAGYLHDIGKISIPAEILAKPGKLSTVEFEIIKSHVEYGYQILKDIELPWDIAHIMYQHHERLDGSGYPQGLTNNKILFEAKILMVADVVEAMTSHRPYRTALGIDRALEEVLNNKEKKYDINVAKAVESLFLKENYEFEDLQQNILFEL